MLLKCPDHNNKGHMQDKELLQTSPVTVADTGQWPIKCSQGNLGRKEARKVEKEKNIDDCQEDQDVVLGLRASLIYS